MNQNCSDKTQPRNQALLQRRMQCVWISLFRSLESHRALGSHLSLPALSSLLMAIAACSLTVSTATPINCDNEQASHLRRLPACSLAAPKFV